MIRRQLHGRCQAIVNGNHHITRIKHCFKQRTGPGSHFPVAHHERAAVNENDYWPDGIAGRTMHVGLQVVGLRSEGFIGVCFKGRFIGRTRQRQCQKECEERTRVPQARFARKGRWAGVHDSKARQAILYPQSESILTRLLPTAYRASALLLARFFIFLKRFSENPRILSEKRNTK